MKSFVAYPLEFEKILFPQPGHRGFSGKLVAHYELYKRIRNINGAVIKCGITANEGFARFTMFKNLMSPSFSQKLVAFEKGGQEYGEYEEYNKYSSGDTLTSVNTLQQALVQKGIKEKVEFIPGSVADTIPEYLIQNPELKIAYLNIDLDDYEATLTALEFFYPRLVSGGILILDNYYKNHEEYNAVNEYFLTGRMHLCNYSVNKGPHYLIKD